MYQLMPEEIVEAEQRLSSQCAAPEESIGKNDMKMLPYP